MLLLIYTVPHGFYCSLVWHVQFVPSLLVKSLCLNPPSSSPLPPEIYLSPLPSYWQFSFVLHSHSNTSSHIGQISHNISPFLATQVFIKPITVTHRHTVKTSIPHCESAEITPKVLMKRPIQKRNKIISPSLMV